MIHYHGTPITPREELYKLAGRHFCVSFAEPRDVTVCHQIGQSVMLDNGAYTFWTQGRRVDWAHWDRWALWVEPWLDHPTTWVVLPDIVDGGVKANDKLLERYAHVRAGAPVWHLHEPLERLKSLAARFERVCFGSSGLYATVGTPGWRRRVSDAFGAIADPTGRVPWVHMLRGLALAGDIYPFASADSTNVARNFKGSHRQAPRPIAAMVAEIDAKQCPARWTRSEQLAIEAA